MAPTARAVAEALWRRWESGDYFAAELFAPGFVYVRGSDGLPGEAGTWTGHEEVGPAVASYLSAWKGMRQKPERFIEVDGDRVLVLDRQVGRGTRSGIVVDHRLGHLVTVRDGLITRLESYWEPRDAFAAAGLEYDEQAADP